MTKLEALRIQRDMLAALAEAAPRGRPEIIDRLRLVTTELLRAELRPPRQESRKARNHEIMTPTDEAPDRTRWWDR